MAKDRQILKPHSDVVDGAYTFEANAMSPDMEADLNPNLTLTLTLTLMLMQSHPEFRGAEGYEGVLNADEILYMPAGMVHQERHAQIRSQPSVF